MSDLVQGYSGITIEIPGVLEIRAPEGARQSPGFVKGVPRLGIPPLWMTDGGLGVADAMGFRADEQGATAFPSATILAGTFDPDLGFRVGQALGEEAYAKGFNVILAGSMNLTRELRNGRNFEYFGEDPLLSGVLAGNVVRGIQTRPVISTLKHFALNAQATSQRTLDAQIDKAALRESDLLAFQIANELGQPGAFMCSYNKVNGDKACNNSWLLNDVLKRDWSFSGWVMSDWGATDSANFAIAGLDQQSGAHANPVADPMGMGVDTTPYFTGPLKQLIADRKMPEARLRDMTKRILRSMFRVGLVDQVPVVGTIPDEAVERLRWLLRLPRRV
jgi:beta-glucosidase